MEELGIGRPSTYASTLAVLRDREYVSLDKKRLKAEDKGRSSPPSWRASSRAMSSSTSLPAWKSSSTAISNHELDWKEVLRDFWRDFSAAIDATKELRTTRGSRRARRALGAAHLPRQGRWLESARLPDLRQRYSVAEARQVRRLHRLLELSGMPLYAPARHAGRRRGRRRGGGTARADAQLGADPATGQDVTVRDGRFGPYVQLGEGEKPKRVSLPKGMTPAGLDLDQALRLLELPKEVATHPEVGEPILVGIGRYGPYVQHGRVYANLERDDDVLEVGANRAIDLIVAKEKRGQALRRRAQPGRSLGEHPALGGEIVVQCRQIRALCQSWQGQRYLAEGHGPRCRDIGPGRRADCRQRRGQGRHEKPPAKSGSTKSTAKKAPAKAATAKKASVKKAAAKTAIAESDEPPFEIDPPERKRG